MRLPKCHFAPSVDEYMVVATGLEKPKQVDDPIVFERMITDPSTEIEDMCDVCLEKLSNALEDELTRLTDVNTNYQQWVDKNKTENDETDHETEQLLASLSLNEKHEQATINELNKINEPLFRELKQLEELLMDSYLWEEECRKVARETYSIERLNEKHAQHIQRLSEDSVFAQAFHIDTRGVIGIINGVRLGINFASQPSGSWSETNAAFGQLLLLIESLRKFTNITFDDYRLVPTGAYSTIKRIGHGAGEPKDMVTLHLYSKSYNSKNDSFNTALLALQFCLAELEKKMSKLYPDLKLPHKVNMVGITDADTNVFYPIT